MKKCIVCGSEIKTTNKKLYIEYICTKDPKHKFRTYTNTESKSKE